jgi:hypothetical protein
VWILVFGRTRLARVAAPGAGDGGVIEDEPSVNCGFPRPGRSLVSDILTQPLISLHNSSLHPTLPTHSLAAPAARISSASTARQITLTELRGDAIPPEAAHAQHQLSCHHRTAATLSGSRTTPARPSRASQVGTEMSQPVGAPSHPNGRDLARQGLHHQLQSIATAEHLTLLHQYTPPWPTTRITTWSTVWASELVAGLDGRVTYRWNT